MRLAEALPVPSEGHNHTRRLPARTKGDMRDETTSDPRRHRCCRRVIDGRRMGSGIRAGDNNLHLGRDAGGTDREGLVHPPGAEEHAAHPTATVHDHGPPPWGPQRDTY